MTCRPTCATDKVMQVRHFLPLALLTTIAWAADPSAAGPDIPDAGISKIYQDAKNQPGDREQRLAKNRELLAAAHKLLADHPEVPPTAPMREILVRRVMLPAAERIFRDDPSPANREQLKTLASEVVNNPVTEGHLIVPEKVRAAYTLARLEIFSGADGAPVDAATPIKALVAAFPPLPAAKDPNAFTGQAMVYAAKLAVEAKQLDLAAEYAKEISAKYLATENAIEVLVSACQAPVFEAELTTLDGRTIKFPADTKGKVVVIDFWATWCGPCVASMPHLKQVAEKFKDKEVLIVGLSCDKPTPNESLEQNKTKVAEFIKSKGFDTWTHTWEGDWPKAAVKYGVSRIPTVFVIGKDGKIISSSARNREESLIEQALAAPHE